MFFLINIMLHFFWVWHKEFQFKKRVIVKTCQPILNDAKGRRKDESQEYHSYKTVFNSLCKLQD